MELIDLCNMKGSLAICQKSNMFLMTPLANGVEALFKIYFNDLRNKFAC